MLTVQQQQFVHNIHYLMLLILLELISNPHCNSYTVFLFITFCVISYAEMNTPVTPQQITLTDVRLFVGFVGIKRVAGSNYILSYNLLLYATAVPAFLLCE